MAQNNVRGITSHESQHCVKVLCLRPDTVPESLAALVYHLGLFEVSPDVHHTAVAASTEPSHVFSSCTRAPACSLSVL